MNERLKFVVRLLEGGQIEHSFANKDPLFPIVKITTSEQLQFLFETVFGFHLYSKSGINSPIGKANLGHYTLQEIPVYEHRKAKISEGLEIKYLT